MFCDNLKNLRKSKGLSQKELAIKLSVVRQTVSKWENGLSVSDAEMLIIIAEALDTTVNALLGEQIILEEKAELKSIASKLEVINEQMAKNNERSRKIWRIVFVVVVLISTCSLLFAFANFTHYCSVINDMNSTESIIGGNVVPTNIYITNGSFKVFNIFFAVIALVISIIGLYKTRKR